ncbi:terpenoid cyclases/protein prenyltransferase alpha-alpha toroid [Chiua virens]|nr:terpenoid cyclases/protein prenyltransferase alpha-alpha toroid [Chiua virens]
MDSLPPLNTGAHAAHCNRCLLGLPSTQVDIDPHKLALVFYCLGSLDLTGQFENGSTAASNKEAWRRWIWEQQIQGPCGTGFRPGNYMTTDGEPTNLYSESSQDPPHVILTYTALLSLAILRDDFSQLDRKGIIKFLQACQNEDGSFSSEPYGGDADVRTTYCAFAISCMLDDWSGVRIEPALRFIASCRSYEGGYGQIPFAEAGGGPTYCALAAIFLAGKGSSLTDDEKRQTIRWLTQNQVSSGGYRGRTNKEGDACYSFWCGASLTILDAREFVSERSFSEFLSSCQFKFGGISKAPKEHPDPYHTYLSLAAIAMFPPSANDSAEGSWRLQPLDPLLNANEATSSWVRKYIPSRPSA